MEWKGIIRFSGYLCLSLLIGTCVEPYEFKVTGTQSALVVDASLTNETKAHQARLTMTFALDQTLEEPVSNARLWIEDDMGNSVEMSETSPGSYATDSSFAGIVGRSYTLNIQLADGTFYQSLEAELLEPDPIDSIYGKYLSIPSSVDETDDFGVQIFLDAHDDSSEPSHYRYEYIESFEVSVPFPSLYDWNGQGVSFEVFEREIPLGTCYRTFNSTTTILSTTQGLKENRISELPIRFIDESEPHLAYNYIIGVRQYSISGEAYSFYETVRENNEFAGSFFDKQKGSVLGNLEAQGEKSIPILGFFEVAGVTEVKRIFNKSEFEEDGLSVEEWVCPEGCPEENPVAQFNILFSREQVVISRTGDTLDIRTEYYKDWSAVSAYVNHPLNGPERRITDIPDPGHIVYVACKICSDCREYGKLEKPEIWK